MELLLDTDFIIKMARYSLLTAFDKLRAAHGHAASPFRYLYEIKAKIRTAKTDAVRSEFGSHIALNSCQSFVFDGLELEGARDYDLFDELREIEGMHQGEAMLVEYALRKPDALIVSGDRRMINGLQTPDGDKFRQMLQRVSFIWTESCGCWRRVTSGMRFAIGSARMNVAMRRFTAYSNRPSANPTHKRGFTK